MYKKYKELYDTLLDGFCIRISNYEITDLLEFIFYFRAIGYDVQFADTKEFLELKYN